MKLELSVNTGSAHYGAYQQLEQKYKTEMYAIASDPKAHCRRLKLEWQHMEYAEGKFANNLVELILKSDMEIFDKNACDPKIYQQVFQNVSWLKQPQGLVRINSKEIAKRDLAWGLGDFLVKHFVKTIPLPPQT